MMVELLEFFAKIACCAMLGGMGVAALGVIGLVLGDLTERYEHLYERAGAVTLTGVVVFVGGVALILLVLAIGIPFGFIE